MYIQDEELRNVFKIASEEHIQKLEEDFLFLEKNPQDKAHLEEALREAHTLKGDARMLGISGVETLTHQVEDLLGAAKRGELEISGKMLDRLYLGLDAIRQLVHEAITDEEARISIFEVLAQLMGAEVQEAEPSKENDLFNDPFEDTRDVMMNTPPVVENLSSLPNNIAPSPELVSLNSVNGNGQKLNGNGHQNNGNKGVAIAPLSESSTNAKTNPTIPAAPPLNPSPQVTQSARSPESATHPDLRSANGNVNSTNVINNNLTATFSETDKYRIDTIRVDPQKLDALMTQVGELTVTKIRISQRLTEIEEIISLWEEWSRDTFVSRLALEKNGKALSDISLGKEGDRHSPKNSNFHRRLEERLDRLGNQLNHLRRNTYEDTARLDSIAGDLKEGIRTLRLLPLATVFNLFPRMVRDLARQQAKEVELIIEGGDTSADKHILEEIKDPLMHLIRNAIDHGIELPSEREKAGKPRVATIRLKGLQNARSVIIEISDDGRGLNIDQIRQAAIQRGICREEELASMSEAQIHNLVFTSGFSTRLAVTQMSGRGVGLDVVRTNIERLKGDVWVESSAGQGCQFRMQIDTTLATTHVLIAAVKDTPYALPVEFVQTTRLIPRQDIFSIEGSHTITIDEHPVSVAWLSDLLELDISDRNFNHKSLPCIILKIGVERLGLIVDALLDEQDVVMKQQSKLLKRIRNVSGATILGTGEVCMVLNPSDLLKSARKRAGFVSTSKLLESVQRKKIVLMVEDSITVRTQVKRIFENAGYEVIAAVDGLDGYEKLRTKSVDAVVSDIQMPHLDGLELTARIRQHKEYTDLPVILVTSLASEEDKRRGVEVGANAYIVKSAFDQNVLLETLGRLI
ncbi:hybrid sensor histidine kinase/response regulator [Pseudanabaena sp. FACHB-1998]|uniref:hybrid sensor histidine kinase/response regulator n=1 Tax=Pseudanabaena sp. FACHB-1998 TaxID=2692858 RepID=UPI001680EB90|nr:hybrid sensor histidine kinase/response regulator [Pseudanabaena sp. FACHB-1998]MBD2177729.1 hybrid sensor histidine kinase/response regulator [Pseudanabaena sp. FACHB-1998]